MGIYEIKVQARYKNLTYTENYKTSFNLAVKNVIKKIVSEPEKKPDIVYRHNWKTLNNTIRNSFEIEPFNKN